MKVLQVNCVVNKGSTGKLVYIIHNNLQTQGVESVICYGRGGKFNETHIYKFCTELESKFYHLLNKFGWLMYRVCPFATRRLINIIKTEKPDIVHLHCLNGYCVDLYRLLRFLGQSGIKTIVTHHSEFYYTGNCGHAYDCKKFYTCRGCHDCSNLKEATGTSIIDRTSQAWSLMKDAFSSFDENNIVFTAVSRWVVNRSALSPLCNKFICNLVTNGVETSIFNPSSLADVTKIKAHIPHPERKIVLHVTASFSTDRNHGKGGYFIKQLAEMLPQYQFVVVASYMGKVEGLPDNVMIWGKADGQKELATLYSAADLTVIASKRETFSMIVAESLCCGTPVVGFKAGGPESIGVREYTRFVDYGDLVSLKDAVDSFINMKWDETSIAYRSSNVYSKETMVAGYLKLYNEMIN